MIFWSHWEKMQRQSQGKFPRNYSTLWDKDRISFCNASKRPSRYSNTKSRRWKALNPSGRNCTTTHSKHSLTTNFSNFTCSSEWKVRLTSSELKRWKSSADWRTRRGNAKKYSRILPVSHRRWLRVLSHEWHMCLSLRGASPMRGWRVLMIRVGMRRRRKFNWIGKFCRRLLRWGDAQSCQQYD